MHQALNACTFLQCCLAEVYLGHSAIAQQLEKAINGLFVPGPGKNSPSQISLSALENLSGRSASIEQNCLQIEPPFPFAPSSRYLRNLLKKTTDFEDFICSLVDIPKKSSCGISLFFYFSLVGSNSSQHPKVCLSDPGRKRCLHTCGLCVGFFLLQLLLSFWAPASRASSHTTHTFSLQLPHRHTETSPL